MKFASVETLEEKLCNCRLIKWKAVQSLPTYRAERDANNGLLTALDFSPITTLFTYTEAELGERASHSS